MYLSSHELPWAIDNGQLIVSPRPEEMGQGYDETSIDLHLDRVEEAKIWNLRALRESEEARGSSGPEVHIGRFNWATFSEKYLMDPPERPEPDALVFRRGPEVIVKPGGFLLWQTKEKVGTPRENPGLICFVDGKSTRARTGLLVHLTAPTIHAGWSGNITLEIVNLGQFHFVLQEDDVIAQLTVALITSPPDLDRKIGASATAGQAHVSGRPEPTSGTSRRQSRRRR
jgi:deoxycytidine triphosphate deaminase